MSTQPFKVGDSVVLNAKGLALTDMTPVKLVEAGFPNSFRVSEIFDVPGSDETAIALAECCGLKDIDGNVMCNAHPADCFDPVSEPAGEKPKWVLSVETPLGRALRLGQGQDYLQLDLPEFLGLKPFRVTGPLKDLAISKLKEWKIIV